LQPVHETAVGGSFGRWIVRRVHDLASERPMARPGEVLGRRFVHPVHGRRAARPPV
jgi:hypothetical protein